MNSNNELYHYGVKGMKWGIRKALRDRHDIATYAKGQRGNASVNKRRRANDVEQRWRSEKRVTELKDNARGYNSQSSRRIRGIKRLATAAAVAGGAYLADKQFNGGKGYKQVQKVAGVGADAVKKASQKYGNVAVQGSQFVLKYGAQIAQAIG